MSRYRFKRMLSCLVIAFVMMFASAVPVVTTQEALYPDNLITVTAYAAVSSSKAKSVAVKDAKSRYGVKKAYSTKVSHSKYKGNEVWVVKFYSKKSGKKYNYTYYVSESSGKILYRKQYIK